MSHESNLQGSHLGELQRLRGELEKEIAEAMRRRHSDPLTITEPKRRKLQLKDAISRLRTLARVR